MRGGGQAINGGTGDFAWTLQQIQALDVGGGGGGAGLMWGLRLLTIKLSGECGDFPCGKDLRRD